MRDDACAYGAYCEYYLTSKRGLGVLEMVMQAHKYLSIC
jgi:hypothetical protein